VCHLHMLIWSNEAVLFITFSTLSTLGLKLSDNSATSANSTTILLYLFEIALTTSPRPEWDLNELFTGYLLENIYPQVY